MGIGKQDGKRIAATKFYSPQRIRFSSLSYFAFFAFSAVKFIIFLPPFFCLSPISVTPFCSAFSADINAFAERCIRANS